MVTHCEPVLSESDEGMLSCDVIASERTRDLCVGEQIEASGLFRPEIFRTIFWPFIYLIFGLQSEKGRTEKTMQLARIKIF